MTCHCGSGSACPTRPPRSPPSISPGKPPCSLEYQSADRDELASLTEAAAPVLAGLPLQHPAELTADPAVRGQLWKLRKGLYASVAGARGSGTTALRQDVVVPVELLADTCAGLHELFNPYRYRDSVIFGHARDGNIHFLITDRFADDEPLRRYAAFTEDMVDLVLAQGGSLKAEHGTGRVMAPYVRRQSTRGLGGRPLDALLADCAEAGVREVIAVIVDADRPASLALHRNRGFVGAGRLAAVGFKHGGLTHGAATTQLW